MNKTDIEALKYPIGKFQRPNGHTSSFLPQWLEVIKTFPAKMRNELTGLTISEIDYIYRPGGWKIKQVVHHTADSHMNAFVRFKLTLTEDTPTIKPYRENLWAELPDTLEAPIEESLKILEGIHLRWTVLLASFSASDYEKKYLHPEQGREVSLYEAVAMYAWHCNHHLAHIRQAKKYKNTF
jgi:hypothetical protein